MREVNNSDLLDVLMEMKEDLGAVKQNQETQTAWMTAHVAEDKLMARDIQTLTMTHARQKGFMTAVVAIGSFISGAIGYAVEFFHRN